MAVKKYSPVIRITTGLLGVLGVVAIGFDALQNGDRQLDVIFFLLFFAKLFVAYIFFYVAMFGTNPLAFLSTTGDGQ